MFINVQCFLCVVVELTGRAEPRAAGTQLPDVRPRELGLAWQQLLNESLQQLAVVAVRRFNGEPPRDFTDYRQHLVVVTYFWRLLTSTVAYL